MESTTSETSYTSKPRNDLIRTISQSAVEQGGALADHDQKKAEIQPGRESFETQHDNVEPSTTSPSDMEAIRTISTQEPVYSVFTLPQKRFIVFMSAAGGFFSAISANIYFPALNALAAEFGVSASLINLTLTTYMIFQGFVPLLVGDLADMAGRRPAYIFCFVIYIAANIGLALCPSYAALMVLRCLQSSGSSTLIALGSGVVADIADVSERGVWMGLNTAGPNVAPALGPVIGGVISQYLGWRWIFWFLLILSCAYMIPLVIFYPETSRNVVGNGSIPPQEWNQSLLNYLQVRRAAKANAAMERTTTRESQQGQEPTRRKLQFPNPLHGLRLLSEKDIGLLLLFNAIVFICYYTTLATTPYLFAEIYDFNDLEVGLCFLPLGVGAILAPIINGNILDWNFRRTAKKLGLVVDRKRATDLTSFPLEKARMQVLMPFVFLCVIAVLIYGWIMHFDAPLAPALVLQFVIGVSSTASFGAMNVLLVDLQPKSPSTVIAANNFCRCWVGAGATALVIPAIEALGTGGAFTLTAGLLLICTPISWVLIKKGPGWREERRVKVAKHTEMKELKKEQERDTQLSTSDEKK
ncbi:Quinidine resistance protein 1 [Elsinoe australis]|uniref:Quinidine resistance protein 1 n=1 Tax=Elsinoe australis TaxID=40998 RepID=A0A2P8A0Y6_9PEZI|nr:Quinidine resistance protein 1 [Elsinoe australis]